MVNWKPNNNIYNTFSAAYQKNTIPVNNTPGRARPIVHYRKQYASNSSSNYYGNHLSTYTNPGANIVSLSNNCIGLSGVGSYMLENKEGCCHTKANPKVIKSGHVEKKRISSNTELLRKRGKTFDKNLPIKKTNHQSGYSFLNVYHDCNGVTQKLQKYNKTPNGVFFAQGAVSASSKILNKKVNAHKKFAKMTNLSRHYVASENSTVAQTLSHLSKIVTKPCCVDRIGGVPEPEPEPEPEPVPVNIYVSGGTSGSPYYYFYTDSIGNDELLDRTLYLDTTYVFHRLDDATSHPFYISDVGYKQQSTTAITLSGNGSAASGITGAESFTLTFNGLSESDTLHYYCTVTAHAMQGTFSLMANRP